MKIEELIKQNRFVDSQQRAIVNLIYTANYFRDINNAIFKKYKLQAQHYNILRILKGKHPEPVTPGYIKEVMLDKGRDLTRLIDKLKKLGYVNREVCAHNKRQMNITLTPAGIKTLESMIKEVHIADEENRKLSDEDFQLLSELLDKMRG